MTSIPASAVPQPIVYETWLILADRLAEIAQLRARDETEGNTELIFDNHDQAHLIEAA